MTPLDYASSPAFDAAVSRARWAVIQTGLITSGLALFGVYVLATRINDLHLMSLYAFGWLPVGPLLVGLICGSGYILAAWWFGVRVGAAMLLGILALQLSMFMACHYADFATLDLVYRDTGHPVSFFTYFHYTTGRLGASDDLTAANADTSPVRRGYLIRIVEAACFAGGGLLAAFMLVGRPKCGLCGGLMRRRTLGAIGGKRLADSLRRLEERARTGDARAFTDEIDSHADRNPEDGPAVELFIVRCEVCSAGSVESSALPEAVMTTVGAGAARLAIAPASATSTTGDSTWRIGLRAEMARQLFDLKPRARPHTPAETVG